MNSRVLFPNLKTALAASSFFVDEDGIGIWLGTTDETLLSWGKRFSATRTAIHIASEDKTGQKLSNYFIESFIQEAKSIGLSTVHQATGYWTHSETKIMQKECVQIAWSEQGIREQDLLSLANRILQEANQDSVAYEVLGLVYHLP